MVERGADQQNQSDADTLRRFSEFRTVLGFVRPYKALVSGAILALIIAAGSTLAIFKSLGNIVDNGFAAESSAAIDSYFLQLLAIIAVLAISTFFRFRLVTLLGERVVADLRKAIYIHLIGLAPVFFEDNRPGEIASRLTADTTVIQNVLGSSASIALRNLLMFLGGVAMLAAISLKLLGLIALVIPVVIAPLVLYGRKVRAYSRSSQDRIADVGAMSSEVFGAIQIVQAFTREKDEGTRFSGAVESAFSAARKRITARAWMTLMVIFLIFGAIDLVLWQGAKDVILGNMSGGDLAAFVGLSIVVAGAVGALAEVYGELQRAAGAAGRLAELLVTKGAIPVVDSPTPLGLPVSGRIAFEGVTFHYPSRPDQAALSDLSFEVGAGETVALVGPSGAGKSTIFQLLLRFFDPEVGVVRLDGIDIRELDPEALRGAMAIVPQDIIVFATSVLENVRYGRPEASDDEVAQAIEAAHASEFIEAMPDGLNSQIGERGVRLSGGQRQRIAIARAILRDAPLLLLDEATSALDSEAEHHVQAAIEGVMDDRTTLVIAHRLATVRSADRIMVIDDGRLVAVGTHEELMERDGPYQKLAARQFRNGADEN